MVDYYEGLNHVKFEKELNGENYQEMKPDESSLKLLNAKPLSFL